MLRTSRFFAGSVALAALFIGNAFAGPSGTTLVVTKDASTTLHETDTYSWNVFNKSRGPNQINMLVLPAGGNAELANFVINAQRSGPVVRFTNDPIAGTIHIQNTGSADTIDIYVVDKLQQSTDGGATWTDIAGQSQVLTATEVAAGGTEAIPYSFNYAIDPSGNTQYRNEVSVSIDNYLGHEGTAFPTVFDATVTVVKAPIVDVNRIGSVNDAFTCPSGFTCSIVSPTFPQTLADNNNAQQIPVVISVQNNALGSGGLSCGQTLSLLNTATLSATPPGPGLPITATATIQAYTGTCPPLPSPSPSPSSSP